MKSLGSLSVLLSVFLGLPCLGEGYQLADEIAAYNQGDYRQVIGVGQLLAAQDSKNAVVHYYLANAYYHLGESPEAEREYLSCIQFSNDAKLKLYCTEALGYLDYLRNQKSKEYEAASLSRPALPFLGSVTITDRSSRLIAAARNAILQQEEDMNNNAVQVAQRRIEDIQQQASRDIAGIPKYFYVFRLPNADHDLAVSKINHEADEKIAKVNDSLADNQRAIKQFGQRKLDELASTIEATQSQRNEGITSLQLAPGSAQIYIKDYLHFDVVPPPAFPASALPGMKKELKQVSNSQSQG